MEKKDKIDIGFKVITVLGLLFSFFYGMHRYDVANKEASAQAFWNQQFPIYKDLCSTASTIATSTDSIEVKRSLDVFWRMYQGEARLVIDSKVHEKLNSFAISLRNIDGGSKNEDLTFKSYELAIQCRKSIAKSWNIPLSEIEF